VPFGRAIRVHEHIGEPRAFGAADLKVTAIAHRTEFAGAIHIGHAFDRKPAFGGFCESGLGGDGCCKDEKTDFQHRILQKKIQN
jgi:hypothetical protein